MNQVTLANTVAFIGALFTLAGVSGVTTTDISGAVNVVAGIVTLVCIVWAHLAHKSQVASLSAPR